MNIRKLLKSGLCTALLALPAMLTVNEADALSYGALQSDGVTCRVVFNRAHIHWGEGKTRPTRKAALADAVRSWDAFVRLEYGRKWDNWQIARKKTIKCSGGGTAWKCIVTAQPCKD
jgi:hypothetical protein